MKFVRLCLITIFLLLLADNPVLVTDNITARVSGRAQVQLLEKQIETQKIQIDELSSRLGKLQKEMQDFADIIADQSSDVNDDDSMILPDPPLRIRNRANIPANVRALSQ